MAIRVAQIMGKMVGGGVESVVMNYYRHIDKKTYQFDFVVDSDSTLIPREEIESLGGRVFIVPPYQRVGDYSKEIRDLCLKENWKIVHSHMNALSVFPLRAAKLAGVPVRIAHSHSTSGKGEYLRNVLKAILKTQSQRYPTDRVACSKLAGDWLFGSSSSYTVFHNAIELDQFAYNVENRNIKRRELSINESSFVVGHIGRFTKQKNHSFLLHVFSEIHNVEQNSILLLIGSGPLEESVRAEVQRLELTDSVRFLGQRDDVAQLYSTFDVFCLPSIYEGLPVVGVEAQAANLPCFFSDAVTSEAVLSDMSKRLSLEIDPALWAATILASCNNASRSQQTDERLVAFDIVSQAPALARFYSSLLMRERVAS